MKTLSQCKYAQELDEADADDGDTILGLVEGESGKTNGTAAPASTKSETRSGKASKVKQVNKIKELLSCCFTTDLNSNLSQVIEQDGVLILETVETDPNDPEALPQV